MIATIAASTGINVQLQDPLSKTGGYLYSSPAADIGKGPRSDPNKHMPTWTPAPNAYNTRQEIIDNHGPKVK